ncbi:MAG: hypothetical protein ACLSIF_11680 [Faecalimonas umbilicata]|jgi:hypothetical protein
MKRKIIMEVQMRNIVDEWKKLNLFSKCSYFSICLLFIMIPFTGLVLESLNIHIISFDIIFGIYVLSIIFSILAKKWKLILIATIGGLVLWAITIGLAEVLWYYLKTWFEIDISYR